MDMEGEMNVEGRDLSGRKGCKFMITGATQFACAELVSHYDLDMGETFESSSDVGIGRRSIAMAGGVEFRSTICNQIAPRKGKSSHKRSTLLEGYSSAIEWMETTGNILCGLALVQKSGLAKKNQRARTKTSFCQTYPYIVTYRFLVIENHQIIDIGS
jgi:hypothetical protein